MELNNNLTNHLDLVLQAVPSIYRSVGYSNMWGIDLAQDKEKAQVILSKFIIKASALQGLLVKKACFDIEETLKWRKESQPKPFPFKEMPELSRFIHMTLCRGKRVMWIDIDEDALRKYGLIYSLLRNPSTLSKLVVGLLETLMILLLEDCASPTALEASFVINCRHSRLIPPRTERYESFLFNLHDGISSCIPLLHSHYPGVLSHVYIINPFVEELFTLALSDEVLRKITILDNQDELAEHLGSDIPTDYGGSGQALSQNDLLSRHKPVLDPAPLAPIKQWLKSTQHLLQPAKASNPDKPVSKEVQTHFSYSKAIGFPEDILDPKDLDNWPPLIPNKGGARVVRIDSNTLVKYGHGVRLAEAEAMHLVATSTTVAVPRLMGAYILDDVCYIIMEYVEGNLLSNLWEDASEVQMEKITFNLKDAVDQIRKIKGSYIGGLGHTTCQDPIFDAWWGSKPITYGPFDSESAFNEGLIQAMWNRFPPNPHPVDPESSGRVSEYINHQTIRSLKDHEIVFTHGDLSPYNIIVRPDCSVVLIDWGLSGYRPEYWEYYRAIVTIPIKDSWDYVVEKYITPYYLEAAIMRRIAGLMWA